MPFRIYPFLLVALLGTTAAWANGLPEVDVFKSVYCGCCNGWIEHMKQHGFVVTVHDISDVPAARKALGMPDRLAACHSAQVDGYVIEGHVHADDIKRVLTKRPGARGLAVPAMVPGSPGMPASTSESYDTLLVNKDGAARIFTRH